MDNNSTTNDSENTRDIVELNADLCRWKQHLRALPDIRRDKVERARRAIRFNQYDDRVVEVTLDRLFAELDVD